MKHLIDCIRIEKKTFNRKISLLEDSLAAFSDISGVPVSFYSTSGKCMWTYNEEAKLCSANADYGESGTLCTAGLSSAMNISLNLGEVYIFTCSSGLINLCYALVLNDKVCGFLIAGPMLMGASREKALSAFSGRISKSVINYTRLIPKMDSVRFFSPKRINSISVLFMDAILAPLELCRSGNSTYQRSQEQSVISSKLIRMKKDHLDVEYPYDSEKKLSDAIRSGNENIIVSVFYKYMEDIMVFEGGNISLIKIRLIAFITQLLRNNDDWQENYEHMFLLDEINKASTVSEVIQSGQKLVSSMTGYVSRSSYSGNSEIIKKAIVYINANYSTDIDLGKIADEIHVNSTYLSVLFRRELGISAVSYIQDLRLSKAEEMLTETDMTVSQISMDCGFSSQSYFTKLFREKYGMTPKNYRKKL